MAPKKRPATSGHVASSKRGRSDLGLSLDDFKELGDFAVAGLEATSLALDRAAESLAVGCIPISGAAVKLTESGATEVVVVGHNGRIPRPDSDETEAGYPTDHGETGAIRKLEKPQDVDWHRVVFATSLSPCVMCGAALTWLWKLGLRRIVVAAGAEAGFSGTAEKLATLEGMTVVSLCCRKAVSVMKTFSCRYPWDWAADIGEVPPSDLELCRRLQYKKGALNTFAVHIFKELQHRGACAAVISKTGEMVASASDERSQSGGNETRSAVMLAMGRAGSALNLRESVLVFLAAGTKVPLAEFGSVSLGACQLFRPAALVVNAEVEAELHSALSDSNINVLTANV